MCQIQALLPMYKLWNDGTWNWISCWQKQNLMDHLWFYQGILDWLVLILKLLLQHCTLPTLITLVWPLTAHLLLQKILCNKKSELLLLLHLAQLLFLNNSSSSFSLLSLLASGLTLLSHGMPQRDTIIHFIWVVALMVVTGLLGKFGGFVWEDARRGGGNR